MFHLKPSNIIFGICISLVRRSFTGAFINMSAAAEASCGAADGNSVAFVTVPSVEVGKKLSHDIVKNKLAACVNMIPQITSIYEWEGKVNEDSEVLLMIKTRTSRVDDLTEYVRKNHPYSVCEVISLPIQNGNPAYLDWINTVVPHKKT